MKLLGLDGEHPPSAVGAKRHRGELFLGDITVEDWSNATLCFANSTCFDDDLMRALADKADLMAQGTFLLLSRSDCPVGVGGVSAAIR